VAVDFVVSKNALVRVFTKTQTHNPCQNLVQRYAFVFLLYKFFEKKMSMLTALCALGVTSAPYRVLSEWGGAEK